MQRYFLKLAFNGTRYHGWQIQDNAYTVQAELNKAISLLTGEVIETIGCGRTDAGVHARAFYVHFDSSQENIDRKRFIYKINKILSKEISCFQLNKVNSDAHARFDAISRTYQYFISKSKDPFTNELSYLFYGKLDLLAMNNASKLLLNYSDFTSFSKTGTQVFTNLCKVKEAIWYEKENQLIFKITADRFLRNMVRAIVGTMLEIGKGKIGVNELVEIIKSKNRCKAGFSVPASGLFLTKIEYPESIIINE